jgi:hypothetical protein
MSDLWYVLILVAVAVVGFRVLRTRRTAEQTRQDSVTESGTASRDYAQERETNRVSHMSESDQTWQAASLQRNRDNQARDKAPAEKG